MKNNIKIALTSPLFYLSSIVFPGCSKIGNNMGMQNEDRNSTDSESSQDILIRKYNTVLQHQTWEHLRSVKTSYEGSYRGFRDHLKTNLQDLKSTLGRLYDWTNDTRDMVKIVEEKVNHLKSLTSDQKIVDNNNQVRDVAENIRDSVTRTKDYAKEVQSYKQLMEAFMKELEDKNHPLNRANPLQGHYLYPIRESLTNLNKALNVVSKARSEYDTVKKNLNTINTLIELTDHNQLEEANTKLFNQYHEALNKYSLSTVDIFERSYNITSTIHLMATKIRLEMRDMATRAGGFQLNDGNNNAMWVRDQINFIVNNSANVSSGITNITDYSNQTKHIRDTNKSLTDVLDIRKDAKESIKDIDIQELINNIEESITIPNKAIEEYSSIQHQLKQSMDAYLCIEH